MSFLTEITARRLAPFSSALSRTTLTTVPRASFTTTVQLRKSPVDTTKDALKSVDRAVSDKLVDGINIGGAYYPFLHLFVSELESNANIKNFSSYSRGR